MTYYQESGEDALRELNSSPDGLTDGEVAARRETYGPNKLKEGKKPSLLQRFFSQPNALQAFTIILPHLEAIEYLRPPFLSKYPGLRPFPCSSAAVQRDPPASQ